MKLCRINCGVQFSGTQCRTASTSILWQSWRVRSRQALTGMCRPSDIVARPASPTVDCPLTPVVVTEGETAKFMVKIYGEPSPSVTWYVNNVAVHNVSSTRFCYTDCYQSMCVCQAHTQPSGNGAVIFFRFWTFFRVWKWSSQWISRGNLDF